MEAVARLRGLLREPGIVQAPGCYDGLPARLVERAGFEAAASRLGAPDTGLLSLRETGDRVAIHPLTLLYAAAHAMAERLAGGPPLRPWDGPLTLEQLRAAVGFPENDALVRRLHPSDRKKRYGVRHDSLFRGREGHGDDRPVEEKKNRV